MIRFEKNIIDYLGLPSIPKKEWDNKSSFSKGVAVVEMRTGEDAYAVATFDASKDSTPHLTKVFGIEPLVGIKRIFVVPNYMLDNVEEMDLDNESKKRAEQILEEAKEVEQIGIEEEVKKPKHEYVFEHIHNDEEAIAFIEAYNKRNRIKGNVPKRHETIIMRLMAIKAELESRQNQRTFNNK